MILSNEKHSIVHYECELTHELTDILRYSNKHYYIYVDGFSIRTDLYNDLALGLRVPGCTIGTIVVDEECNIQEIYIADSYMHIFEKSPEEIINKYKNEKIELKEDE